VPLKINFEHSTGSTGDLFSEANPLKSMTQSATSSIPRILAALLIAIVFICPKLPSQQTVGGITGEVTDPSGGVIVDATVTVLDEQTALSRTVKTNGTGVYSVVNLPIGTYTLTFTAEATRCKRHNTSPFRQTARQP
jgi:hypothetical protein